MARKRTQKEISARYKDNLANYKRLYGWRRAAAAITFLALVAGALAIGYYYKQAPDKFFNPGPVSKHHQNISRLMIGDISPEESSKAGASGNCDACHDKSLITGDSLTSSKFVQVLKESFRKGASADRI